MWDRQIFILFLDAREAAIAHVQVDEEVLVAAEAKLSLVGALGLTGHAHGVRAVVPMLPHTDTELAEVGKAGYLAVNWVVHLDHLLRVILVARHRMAARQGRYRLEVGFLLLEAPTAGVLALVPDGRLALLATNAASLPLEHLRRVTL